MSVQSLKHLAIIPDGNRRWSARNQVSLERTYLDSCTKIFHICRMLETLPGLLEVSLFFLSIENLYSRPRAELDPLFSAGHHFLDLFYESALGEAIDLRWVGMHESEAEIDSALYADFVQRLSHLPKPRRGERTVNVLMGYDVRKDIEGALRFCRTFSYENLAVNRRVDLIVRSGGHQRLSGFLPLMCQYSEFEFIEALFPDVTLQDIADSIGRFGARTRKFGA